MSDSQSIEGHSPETTTQMLADRAAIVDLTHRYCWALDTHDWADLDFVFTQDASADILADVVGREAIKTRVETALMPLHQTQHLVANHQIILNGDTATCRCYLQAQHVRKKENGGDNFIVGGRYEDELRRTPDGWRISFRRLLVMWTQGKMP